MQTADRRLEEVLAFWFPGPGRDKRWFDKDPEFDETVRRRFLAVHEAAAAGRLDSWMATARGCLALILVLDQFPRNMFRGTARAFATDAKALEVARHAVEKGYDRSLSPVERLFVYLPFEHAESLEAQDMACRLTEPLNAYPETHDAHAYALRHREIIQRFGRFPHRNAALGRESTPEEVAFLATPGSSF
ncbi:MAG TPA: DUF924 family protein [Burkholderiales bacterium]|nr:DUF924 family protein [Burkholderiales bacterium]